MNGEKSDTGAAEEESDRNYTEAVSTRLTRATKRRYDTYRDERELGNAQALRRLVRAGLDAEESGESDANTDRSDDLLTVSMGAAVVYFLIQATFDAPTAFTIAGGGAVVALLVGTLMWRRYQ